MINLLCRKKEFQLFVKVVLEERRHEFALPGISGFKQSMRVLPVISLMMRASEILAGVTGKSGFLIITTKVR